ncbi:MAG: multiubiquitin domain-containing protein [Abitibacteriaceae bacterium]|nr:multiubiquitin domain-containing protein [Abditibacteriaceae bacterium]
MNTGEKQSYEIRIDEQTFHLSNPEPTGREIFELIGKDPTTHFLVQILVGQDDIEIGLNDNLDLRAPGVERIDVVTKARQFVIRIDEQSFHLTNSQPTGRELLELVGRTPDQFLLTLVLANEPDRLIDPDEHVDISRPGVEQFAVVAKKPHKITIFVNTRPVEVEACELSFEQVVRLAYPTPRGGNWEYTVKYEDGPCENPEGVLIRGKSVHIQEGMIFNVTETDKS